MALSNPPQPQQQSAAAAIRSSAQVEGDLLDTRRAEIRIVRTVIAAGSVKHMAKSHLNLVAPATIKRTVIPKRLPNADPRTRQHLIEAEVERLMNAARKDRWGHRDASIVLVTYRRRSRAATAER
jgi:hypothetical protein